MLIQRKKKTTLCHFMYVWQLARHEKNEMGHLSEKGPDTKIDIWHVSMGRMQKWYGVYE